MSHEQKGAPSTAKEWERTLIEDYRNYRWNQVMEPLCDKLQLWKDGQVGYEELDQFMEKIHHQIWEVRNVFGQRKDRLVNLISAVDQEIYPTRGSCDFPPSHREPGRSRGGIGTLIGTFCPSEKSSMSDLLLEEANLLCDQC